MTELNALEARFLTEACRNIISMGEEAWVDRFYNLTHAELDALTTLMQSVYIVGSWLEEDEDGVEAHVRKWDAEKVLQWGRNQEPLYRMVGLEWESEQIRNPDRTLFVARTIAGKYSVGLAKVTEKVLEWRWCPPIEGHQTCHSLEHGKQLCEAHWLETLIDGGVIERVEW